MLVGFRLGIIWWSAATLGVAVLHERRCGAKGLVRAGTCSCVRMDNYHESLAEAVGFVSDGVCFRLLDFRVLEYDNLIYSH